MPTNSAPSRTHHPDLETSPPLLHRLCRTLLSRSRLVARVEWLRRIVHVGRFSSFLFFLLDAGCAPLRPRRHSLRAPPLILHHFYTRATQSKSIGTRRMVAPDCPCGWFSQFFSIFFFLLCFLPAQYGVTDERVDWRSSPITVHTHSALSRHTNTGD